MTNNSFRIKHYSTNEQGTVWPISAHQYSVQMDGLANTHTFSKAAVEDLLECGVWEKVQPVMDSYEPVRSFKFIVPDCEEGHKGLEFSMKIFDDDSTLCQWGDNGYTDCYTVYSIQRHLDSGDWIIVDEKPSVNLPDNISCKNLEDYKEMVSNLCSDELGILEQIKSFTSGTGHDVFISGGSYKVYRKHEDSPYICHTDDQLVAVMDALIVLDEVGVE